MATREQIESILGEMAKLRPENFLRQLNRTQAGIGAVICLLNESRDTVTAGRISEVLHISTARVAVLLKKMEAKGLIAKAHDEADARVTVVRLTAQGQETARQMRGELCAQIGRVIDQVGEERVRDFISLALEIRAAAEEPFFHF